MTTNPYKPNPDRYWAAEEPENIAAAINHRFRRYHERLKEEGRIEVWRIADICYHGRNPDGGYSNAHVITFGGEQGETAQLHIGHFRALIRDMHGFATEQRPAIEITAKSNDPESTSSTIIGRQLLEYDLDEGGLEEALLETHTRALLYAEGYIVQTWDPHAGEDFGTREITPEAVDAGAPGIPGEESGEGFASVLGTDVPVRSGDVRVDVRSPLDVARDLDLDRLAEHPWYIVRTRVHRWELAARYPDNAEVRQAILEAPAASLDDDTLWGRRRSSGDSESDYIHVLTLYHQRTDALPDGRIVDVVGDVALPGDGPYPYDHCVVHRDIPSAETDRAVGYGDTWDLLALSQALDSVESGLLSIVDASSSVNWVAPRGQKVDTKQLEASMTLVEYDDDGRGAPPPGLMDRPEVRDSDLKVSEHYRATLETLSGINATVRGTAESEAKSGADRALIATMAVRANNWQQRSYANLARSVFNGRIALYREFLSEERTIEIAGRDKEGHVATVRADDLEHVRRVRVELGPPDLRTIEGKMALADRMVEIYGPEVITPERYQALRATGRLDDLVSPIADHKVLARKENDLFREGQGERVTSMLYHHHACHISEHACDLNNLELLMDPNRADEIKQRLAHIMQHVQHWQVAPPEILSATGQAPAPSSLIGPPPGAGPMPGALPPGGPVPPPGGPPAPVPGAPPPIVDGGPGLPALPTNPLTNEPGVPGIPAAEG